MSNVGIAVALSSPCRFLHCTTQSRCLPLTPLSKPYPLRPITRRRTHDSDTSSSTDSSPIDNRPSDEDILKELEKREGFRRKQRRRSKEDIQKARRTYQIIAGATTLLMCGLTAFATYFKLVMTRPKGSPFPWIEFAATCTLVAVGAGCMEMYARWAHRVWWHDLPGGWALHKSHHAPRTGPFEANDIYAVANAIPAFTLCFFGFFRSGVLGAVMFGLGLGITLFGMAYMFVHDGLVHKRFPVGPLANVPFMKRVAAAHMLHHANKYNGKPYGMFLGPQEISHIPGAIAEMERLAAIL